MDDMEYIPIHRNVLIVAHMGGFDGWRAYCVLVPGENHEQEQHLWRDRGAKLSEKHARAFFPQFDQVRYAK